MFQRLRCKNFQCHDRLDVEFANVTTFVGSSDRGKSAIIRAIRWLCQNRPQGEDFIKDGTKGTTVQVLVNGETITRRRGASTNTYHLGEDEYKAFGTGVPDTIANKLRVDDINFQQQFDAPFWFALSPGEVSRQINQIVDLGVIDSSLSNISKVVRETQQETKFISERLKIAKDRRDELGWCLDADLDLRKVERLDEERSQILRSAATLQKYVSDVVFAIERRENARQHAGDAHKLLSLATLAREAEQDARTIARTISDHNELNEVISRGVPDFHQVQSTRTLYDECEAEINDLRLTIEKTVEAYDLLIRLAGKVESVSQQFADECDGICPICGGKLDENCDETQRESLQTVSS